MDLVKTGVDELMELLTQEKRLTLSEAAKRLGQPERTVQNWVDFLVEERILGIEYKFTTPYIYLNEPTKAAEIITKQRTLEDEQRDFARHAQEKGMPVDKLPLLWHNHLERVIDGKQEFFSQECEKRGFSQPETRQLFARYKERALTTHELRATH